MTSSHPNYLPKALSPTTIILGDRVPTSGGDIIIQSVTAGKMKGFNRGGGDLVFV